MPWLVVRSVGMLDDRYTSRIKIAMLPIQSTAPSGAPLVIVPAILRTWVRQTYRWTVGSIRRSTASPHADTLCQLSQACALGLAWSAQDLQNKRAQSSTSSPV